MNNRPFHLKIWCNWFEKKAPLLLWIGIFVYCIIFIGGSLWKYYHFGYNALDLAIFNQVFYNTSSGELFSLTIHPHSYLGDHFELFILLLVPLYSLFRHPLTLLILQTLTIALAAWPLYLIVKKIANKKLALFIGAIFLLNPFIQNINLFEFHLLPFAIFFIFFTFYFYLSNRFSLFLIFSFLALLVREDVALIIIMFSIVSLLDKKSKYWILFPLIMGVGWLVTVFFLIPTFSGYESYKFLFYYSWLGDSVKNIIVNFFTQPLKILSHLFSIQNISLILALFLPFLLLPILKPKYLLLSILVFFQVLLGGFSSELILKTHYCSLLLPPLFLTTAIAISFIFKNKTKGKFSWQTKIKKTISKELPIFFTILMVVTLYAAITFGPLFPLVKEFFLKTNSEYLQLKNNYLDFISKEKAVTTTYDFLPKLSSRERIYSLHYAFIGKKQYSQELYQLPDTDFLLLDTSDFLIYQIQYPPNSFYKNAYSEGDNRIRSIIQKQNLMLVKASDGILLFQKKECKCNSIIPYEIHTELLPLENKMEISASPKITFLGWNHLEISELKNPTFQLPLVSFPVSLFWQTDKSLTENLQLSLEIKNKDNITLYQKYYPLAYGIYPTTEWQVGQIIQTNYWFLLPEEFAKKSNNVSFKLVRLKKDHPYLGLDGLLSATSKNVNYESVGEKIIIPMPTNQSIN